MEKPPLCLCLPFSLDSVPGPRTRIGWSDALFCVRVTVPVREPGVAQRATPARRHAQRCLFQNTPSSLPQPAPRDLRERGDAADGYTALSSSDCAPLATACGTLGDGVRLDWRVAASSAANAPPTLAARLTSTKGGYASFGFPSTPGKMVGAKVVILRECENCTSGAALDVYSLNGKKGALVNPDPTALTVVPASSPEAVVRTSDGGLSADFEVELPSALVPNAASIDYIAATGPLKQDGVSPAIHKWTGDGVLKSLVAKAGDKKKAAAAAAVADAPAPAPTPTCLSATGAPYHACMDAGGGVRLLWNSTTVKLPTRRLAAAAPLTTLRGTLETSSGGYASFGFPESPGKMVGAKVLVLRDCSGCPDCPPSGARLDPYSLNGKRGSEVLVDPAAFTLTPEFTATRKLGGGGGLGADFEVALPPGVDPTAVNFITATGPLKPSGDVAIHTATGDGVLDVTAADRAAAAGSAGAVVDVDNAPAKSGHHRWFGKVTRHRMERVHGWLMAVAWDGLSPLAIGVALGTRGGGGAWFTLHRALQCATLLLSSVGLILGALSHADKPDTEPEVVVHVALGSTVVGLALLQGSALFFRPHPAAAGRATWTAAHKTVGYITAAGSIANLVLGCVCAGLPVGYPVAAALVPLSIYASFGAARVVRGRTGAAGLTRAERADKMATLPSGPDGSISSVQPLRR